jgi:hypothetical protein
MNKAIVKTVIAMAFALMVNLATAQDFGDHSSATLTTQAWSSMAQGNNDLTITYANKCLELYMGNAEKMQASLSDFVTESNEKISSYWALNDVGTCLFIKGQALMKKGDKKGATEAFKLLTEKVKFAQCWDTNGWFWKPAEAAKQLLVEMSYDSE